MSILSSLSVVSGQFLVCYRLENLPAASQETERICIVVHLG